MLRTCTYKANDGSGLCPFVRLSTNLLIELHDLFLRLV